MNLKLRLKDQIYKCLKNRKWIKKHKNNLWNYQNKRGKKYWNKNKMPESNCTVEFLLNLKQWIKMMDHIQLNIKFHNNVNVKLMFSSYKMENKKQLEEVDLFLVLLQRVIQNLQINLMDLSHLLTSHNNQDKLQDFCNIQNKVFK